MISVTGMSCNGCEQNVETALQNLDGVIRSCVPIFGSGRDDQRVETIEPGSGSMMCERRTHDRMSRVDADHEANTVNVVLEDEISDDDVNAAIEEAGYDVVA